MSEQQVIDVPCETLLILAGERIKALEQQLAELLPWKQALEDIGVVNWTLTGENANDSKRLIYDRVAQLLIREQLDPTVQALRERLPRRPGRTE